MGRAPDSRKRPRKGSSPASPSGEAPAAPPRPAEPRPARAKEPARAQWVMRDESLVFPADAAPGVAGSRLALPSSGLAEDILALADAAAIPAAVPRATEPALPAVPEAAARAHNISFFSPVREDRKAVEATEHLATFFLGREEYGVDVKLVDAIIRVLEITHVPRAPGFIKGVINLRGRIIPVVDLKRKLNLGEVETTRQSRIVVAKLKDRLIGLLVDGAHQVLKVPVSSIEAAPEEVVEIDANYIRGVAKLADRLIILMDLPRVLAVELREASEEKA